MSHWEIALGREIDVEKAVSMAAEDEAAVPPLSRQAIAIFRELHGRGRASTCFRHSLVPTNNA